MAWMLSLKVVLISTGVLFTALGLKVSVPLFVEFVATFVPVMSNFFSSCFKPPYLYFIINGIIISIVASSRFHRSGVIHDDLAEPTPTPPSNDPPSDAYEMESPPEIPSVLTEPPSVYNETIEEPPLLEVRAIVVNGASVAVEDEDEDDKAMDDMDSTWRRIKKMDSTEIPWENLSTAEKPLVSAAVGHRKPLEASPEGGRSLKVTKLKRQETLENAWKAIREGRDMPPLSRHMKECEAWENHGRQVNVGRLSVKKSETFKDRTNELAGSAIPCSSSSMKLQKEASLSQDELNRQVEAFIRKFNKEMRLQRQASLNQYMPLINH